MSHFLGQIPCQKKDIVLIITCTSSSVNPITDRAFITAFQLFLSLTELILGQLP